MHAVVRNQIVKMVTGKIDGELGGLVFSGRRRHTRLTCDWSSDVCSSDLEVLEAVLQKGIHEGLLVSMWGAERVSSVPMVAMMAGFADLQLDLVTTRVGVAGVR